MKQYSTVQMDDIYDKMKTKNTTLSELFQNPMKNHRNIGKIDSLKRHIHDRSFPWLGTDTYLTRDNVVM